MEHFPFVYNSIEIGIWAAFGVGFVIAAIKNTGAARMRCFLVALVFFLFGASDVIELHTGAWWKPWWLFAWKAACVTSLLGLYVEHVLLRIRRAKRTVTSVEVPSDGQHIPS